MPTFKPADNIGEKSIPDYASYANNFIYDISIPPYDDVTDIELRALEGALCGVAGKCGTETTDPNKGTAYTDGARAAGPDAAHLRVTGKVSALDTYLDVFPYLNTPLAGSPSGVAE